MLRQNSSYRANFNFCPLASEASGAPKRSLRLAATLASGWYDMKTLINSEITLEPSRGQCHPEARYERQ